MGKHLDKQKGDLDEELAAAAGLDDGDEPGVYQPPAPTRKVEKPRSKPNLGLLAMLLLMVGGIVCLFMFGITEAAVYSLPLDEFLARKAEFIDKRVRIEGELKPGTLVRREDPCEYRFRMFGVESREKDLEVRFPQCIVPENLRDVPEGGVQLTVQGKYLADGHIEASEVLAKCSSKYDPKSHSMEGEKQASNP